MPEALADLHTRLESRLTHLLQGHQVGVVMNAEDRDTVPIGKMSLEHALPFAQGRDQAIDAGVRAPWHVGQKAGKRQSYGPGHRRAPGVENNR